MSNWTAIILIPPLSANTEELLEYCNEFLKEQYTHEKGWDSPFSFELAPMPFVPNALVGQFPYFHEAEFIKRLKNWFHPEPIYRVVDETEKPTKYISQAFTQVNERWGTFQVVIRREHDDQFWFLNITKEGTKSFGHLGVKGL